MTKSYLLLKQTGLGRYPDDEYCIKHSLEHR